MRGVRGAKKVAGLLESRPWDSPEYRAGAKARLDRRIRRVYGDKAVDGWVRVLKSAGLWKG